MKASPGPVQDAPRPVMADDPDIDLGAPEAPAFDEQGCPVPVVEPAVYDDVPEADDNHADMREVVLALLRALIGNDASTSRRNQGAEVDDDEEEPL